VTVSPACPNPPESSQRLSTLSLRGRRVTTPPRAPHPAPDVVLDTAAAALVPRPEPPRSAPLAVPEPARCIAACDIGSSMSFVAAHRRGAARTTSDTPCTCVAGLSSSPQLRSAWLPSVSAYPDRSPPLCAHPDRSPPLCAHPDRSPPLCAPGARPVTPALRRQPRRSSPGLWLSRSPHGGSRFHRR
jgi:hypothetical protein